MSLKSKASTAPIPWPPRDCHVRVLYPARGAHMTRQDERDRLKNRLTSQIGCTTCAFPADQPLQTVCARAESKRWGRRIAALRLSRLQVLTTSKFAAPLLAPATAIPVGGNVCALRSHSRYAATAGADMGLAARLSSGNSQRRLRHRLQNDASV